MEWSAERERAIASIAAHSKTVYSAAMEASRILGVSYDSARSKLKRMIRRGECMIGNIHELVMIVEDTGNGVLVIPDLEAPFQDDEFVENVLGVCSAWHVDQCVFAGDAVHFESISPHPHEFSVDLRIADRINEIINTAKTKKEMKEMMSALLQDVIDAKNFSDEMAATRSALGKIIERFDTVYFIMGNHEKRFVRALENSGVKADDLGRMILSPKHAEKAKFSSLYWCIVRSGGETFQIEHPNSSSERTARDLATKFGRHVIMGHSHRLQITFDLSGRFWAIHAGHCVDEGKLQYTAQRHAPTAHAKGAVIIRNGHPYVMTTKTDWKAMQKMFA